jgi:hypothetical protein
MYTDTPLFFPRRAITALSKERGPEWQALVAHVLSLPPAHQEALAFMWLMVRLNGCVSCETDSYRALRGCAACAVQTLRRYKGDDADLLRAYAQALDDVQQFAQRDPRFQQIFGDVPASLRSAGD